MKQKALYKEYLQKKISDNPEMEYKGDITKAIYIIDEIIVDGCFHGEYRTIDHFQLMERQYGPTYLLYFDCRSCDLNCKKEMSFEELVQFGIVIVPETRSYISNEEYEPLEKKGFKRLPLDDNHLVGFRD